MRLVDVFDPDGNRIQLSQPLERCLLNVIRRGGQPDVPFMRSLLTHAYNWHVNVLETEVPIEPLRRRLGAAAATPRSSRSKVGHRIGAGWFRLFREAAPGYGFVDDETPEVTVVVIPSRQGQGIGQLLLAGLVERAQADAYRAPLGLGREDGPEVATYEAAGFEQIAETGTRSRCDARSSSAAKPVRAAAWASPAGGAT